jgi:hypothetical protein
MFVKPGPNPEKPGSQLMIRIPRTHAFLPETGAEVPNNPFWRWMLRHGDVVKATPPAPSAAPAAAAPATPAPAAATPAAAAEEPAHAAPAAQPEK